MNNFETRLERNGVAIAYWDSPTPAPIYPKGSRVEILGLAYKVDSLPTLRIPEVAGGRLVTVYQVILDGYVEDSR